MTDTAPVKKPARKKEQEPEDYKSEEIRGIFVLGLLAVLAAIRIQNRQMIVMIGQLTFDVAIFLDVTILFWSLYAFFMVLGLSKDIVGRNLSENFRGVAKACLTMDFVLMAMFTSLFGYYAYPTRVPWALGLFAILVGYIVVKKFSDVRKKSVKIDLKKTVLGLLMPVLTLILTLSFMTVMFVNIEVWVVPSFVVGVVSILLLIGVGEWRQHNKKKDNAVVASD